MAKSFEADLEEIRAFTDQLRQMRAEVQQHKEELKAGFAEGRAAQDEARRKGEHGRDWQILQQRIDMRRTTLDDIMNGLDHSSEAKAVRRVLGGNLAKVRDAYAKAANDSESELAAGLAEVEESRRRLAELIEAGNTLQAGNVLPFER